MTSVRIENLDHETLASIFDTVLKERLDLLDSITIRRLGKRELPRHLLEVFS